MDAKLKQCIERAIRQAREHRLRWQIEVEDTHVRQQVENIYHGDEFARAEMAAWRRQHPVWPGTPIWEALQQRYREEHNER